MPPSLLLTVVLLLAPSSLASKRHASVASFASSGANSFASSYAGSGSFAGAGSGAGTGPSGQAAGDAGANFWWNGPNSPFQHAQEMFRKCVQTGDCSGIPGSFVPPSGGGCGGTGCGFGDAKTKIDVSKNPFLNGKFSGLSISSCSGNLCPEGKPSVTLTKCENGQCQSEKTSGGGIDLSKNPFLNGAFSGVGTAGSFSSGGVKGGQGHHDGQFAAGAGTFTGGSGVPGGQGGFSSSGVFSSSGSSAFAGSGSSQHGSSGQQPQVHFGAGQQGQGHAQFPGAGQPAQGQGQAPFVSGGPQQGQGQGHFGTGHPQQGQGQFGAGHTQQGEGQTPFTSGHPQQGQGQAPFVSGQPQQAQGQFGGSGQPQQQGQGQCCGQQPQGQHFGGSSGAFAGSSAGAGAFTSPDLLPPVQPGSWQAPQSIPSNPPAGTAPFTSSQSQSPNNFYTSKPPVFTSGASSPGAFSGPVIGGGPDAPFVGSSPATCSAQDHVCVQKHLCVNGVVNVNGNGLVNHRIQDNVCQPHEVCCRLPPSSAATLNTGNTVFTSSTSGSSSSSSSSSHSTSSNFFTSAPAPTSSSQFSHPPKHDDSLPQGSGVIPTKLRPGQTYKFPGSAGSSPGSIQVIPEGSAPGQTFTLPASAGSSPGVVQVLPSGTSGATKPAQFHVSNDVNFKDVKHEYIFASTIKGPPYLPPSPDGSAPPPSVVPPELEPPRISTYNPPTQPPVTSRTYIPPTTKYIPPQTTKYIPPQTTKYVPPQTTRYIPPQTTTPYVPRTTPAPPPTRPPLIRSTYLPPDSSTIRIQILTTPRPSPTTPRYIPPPTTKYTPPTTRYVPPTTTKYLPPRPDESPSPNNPDPSILRPNGPSTPNPFNMYTTPYPGCAAALKCVKAEFCTAEGVMSKTPVVLTKEQEITRVPLTDCTDLETNTIGKCCRDPDYKDPWPASQLGLYDPIKHGGPPPQRPPPPQNPTKGGRRPLNDPNLIDSPSNTNQNVQGYPSVVPNIPFNYRQQSTPLQVNEQEPIETGYSNKVPVYSKASNQNCGVRRPGGSPKGFSPIHADFAEIPWQAMILRDSNRSLLCGGAIIRKNAVITAAHCLDDLPSEDVLVKGGEWKLGVDDEPKPFQIIKVASIVRHPGYNPDTRLNDVAILILKEKFRIDKNVDTICLPPSGENVEATFQNAKCITTGWGKTILQLHAANALMNTITTGIIPSGQCQAQMQQSHQNLAHLYNPNCVCAHATQPNTDMCDVDIGSALACDRGDGHYTLAGIYSWDTGCQSPNQLGGYTKVDIEWIENTFKRPIQDLKTEESGFLQKLSHQHTVPVCHCQNGKK